MTVQIGWTALDLLPALGSGGSVVDLDGTFFVQVGIFFVVWIILARGYFRPTLKALDARHEGTQGRFEIARRLEAQSDQWSAKIDTTLADARAQASTARAGLIVDAEGREREVFEGAEKTSRERVNLARERIQSEMEAARKELRPRAETLASEIASKVLGRKIA